MSKTYFVAGINGVGKSYLVSKLSELLDIPMFNASDLISEENNEDYSRSKSVNSKENNQNILIKQVERKLEEHDEILLTGHCCIMTKKLKIDKLPDTVFNQLHISKFIVIESSVDEICSSLLERDSIKYSYDFLNEFMKMEYEYSRYLSEKFSFQHYQVVNDFSNEPISMLKKIIMEDRI